MAVATISEHLAVSDSGPLAERTERLVEAVRDANRRIVERGARESDLHRMGTTLVALLLHDDNAAIVHVGDSRAYRWRDGQLSQLTTDHTLVADLLRANEISETDASRHPYRHVLTRALGAAEDVEADVNHLDIRPGDVYLLCTDGVSGMLSEPEIETIASGHHEDPQALGRELITAANHAGGKDNATVIVVRCTAD
jgi:protein phosphatase